MFVRELSNKWKQKSGVISELEKQVSQMTSTWTGKEKKLTDERDRALEAARWEFDNALCVFLCVNSLMRRTGP